VDLDVDESAFGTEHGGGRDGGEHEGLLTRGISREEGG
jgi:hypothetical protein